MFMEWPEHFTKHMASNQLLMLGRNLPPTRFRKIVKINQMEGFDHDPDSLRR